MFFLNKFYYNDGLVSETKHVLGKRMASYQF